MVIDRPLAVRAIVAAGLLAAGLPAVQAETVQLRPQLSIGVLMLSAREEGKDRAQVEALNLNPSLGVRLHGARVKVDGNIGAETVMRSDDGSNRTVRPRGNLQVRLIPLVNALDIDLSATAERVGANPFAARPDGLSNDNEATAVRYRVAPTFARALSSDMAVLARSEHVWSRTVDAKDTTGTLGGSLAEEQEFRLERAPTPTGWTLEGLRQRSKLNEARQDTIELQSIRAVLSMATTDQVVLGLSLGRERAQYLPVDRVDTLYGVRARWLPSQRTEVKAAVERRFFGTGFETEARHRSPTFGMALRAFREPLVQAGRNLQDPSFTNVSYILSDILTTRNPDAVTRETAVRGIVNSLGLTQPLSRAMDLNASYAQMHSGGSGTVVFYNRTSLISATAFLRRQERLRDAGDVIPQGTLSGDIDQRGLELGVQHRLSPRLALDMGVRLGKVKGMGLTQGDWSDDLSARVGALYALSPNSSLQISLRHQQFDSNVLNPVNETSLSASLTQRF